jgi:hypothetical protein
MSLPKKLAIVGQSLQKSPQRSDVTNVLPIRLVNKLRVQSSHYVRYSRLAIGERDGQQRTTDGGKHGR